MGDHSSAPVIWSPFPTGGLTPCSLPLAVALPLPPAGHWATRPVLAHGTQVASSELELKGILNFCHPLAISRACPWQGHVPEPGKEDSEKSHKLVKCELETNLCRATETSSCCHNFSRGNAPVNCVTRVTSPPMQPTHHCQGRVPEPPDQDGPVHRPEVAACYSKNQI